MAESTARVSLVGTAEAALPAASPDTASEVVVLFDQFRERLLRYVLSMGVSVSDGEDIIQEVFLSLFRHLRLGKSRSNLPGWIFRVAHNLALKQRNRKQKLETRTELDPRAVENQVAPVADPEEQLADDQRHKRLLAVVRALPEQDQWCLYMRAEGLRYREIAEALGISLGAVSNSLARSMARLTRVNAR
jgi:RNA polymerase sigma-70 factor (ECF subfamily)